MYEFFLDDVAAHGFNTVWVDVTKELEAFDKLAAEVPGAIARYLRRRSSAQITVRRLETWDTVLGRILSAVVNNRQRPDVQTLLTSVSWAFENMTTPIHPGHPPR